MYSLHEKLVELCPVIKELLVEDGTYKQSPASGGGGGMGGGNAAQIAAHSEQLENQ